tara:strand:- start:101 stop:385 length:285 start_codon:yes stop_codon:yes gene_type:complete
MLVALWGTRAEKNFEVGSILEEVPLWWRTGEREETVDIEEIKRALDGVFEREVRAVDAAEKLKEVAAYCEELLEGLGYEFKRISRRSGSEAHRP